MKLAFSAPTRDDEQTRTLFEQFRAVGFEGLQLKPPQYEAYLDAPDRLLATWPSLRGGISGLIIGGRLDAAGCEKLHRLFRFAGAVGAERVVLCHATAREPLTDADLQRFVGQLDELGAAAREQGTKLSLHHHHNQPCMHRRDFDIFFDQPRSYGLTLDTAHLVKSGVHDVPEVIRTFGWAIDNFHMKDFADGAFRVLGQGEVDFDAIFEAVRASGYDGPVAADEESGGDLLAGMRTCHAVLARGLLSPDAEDAPSR